MKQVRLHPEARKELEHSVRYYNEIDTDLARNFISDFEETVEFLVQNPNSTIEISPEIHRILFKKFKYSIIYFEKHNVFQILAVTHQRRKPNYWLNRKK